MESRGDHQISHEQIAREAFFCMGPDNMLTYANAAFLRRFGYSSVDEYNNQEARTIFADIVDQAMVRACLEKKQPVTDKRILCKTRGDGSFWGLFSFIPDDPQSFTGAVIDITTLVEKENFLRSSTIALEKSNIELDRFIYSASHDIRAPISTVMGLVNLINLEPRRDQQMDLVGMIGSTMTKLDIFLHQLHTHARNSHQHIYASQLNLVEIVENAVGHWRDHPSFPSISIIMNIGPAGVFRSDAERLTAALVHIIKNSLDFVDVSKAEKKLDIQGNIIRDRLVLEIFDNGVGIPEDKVSNVFDMFFKGSVLSKGAGLGMFLVREIMARLNGVATIYSKLGIGTLVRLEIPNTPEPSAGL